MSDKIPPPLSSDDLVFTEATDRQRTLSWRLNALSWGGSLHVEEYVGREKTLSETALSVNGGTRYWVLHPKDDPDAVVSSCETTAKKVLVADDQGRRLVDAYSVASVFTDPRYRARGFASYLLLTVQKILDENHECGSLYSDVGRQFYAGLGWPDFRSPQAGIAIEEGFEAPPLSDKVTLLPESEIAALCQRDIDALEQKFDGLAEKKDGNTYATFLPSIEQCGWQFARAKYNAQVMRKRSIESHGAATVDGASWLYWDHDLREKKLKILRIVTQAGDPAEKRIEDVKVLLLAALREALAWDLVTVLIWNPNLDVGGAAVSIYAELGEKLRVVFDERQDGSIPSLRWKNGEEIKTVWVDNEYYAWC